MTVTMAKVNFNQQDPGEGTIWFDYFFVTDPTISTTVGAPSATGSSVPRPNPNRYMGVIVGCVIGGLFFLLAIVLVTLYYRRIREKSALQQQEKANLSPSCTLSSSSPSCSFSLKRGLSSIQHRGTNTVGILPSILSCPEMALRMA